MAKRSNRNTRFKNAHATPRKPATVQNRNVSNTPFKRLFYSLIAAIIFIGLISASEPFIRYIKTPKAKKVDSHTIHEANIARIKLVEPLAEDDPSLPKPYGYETVLAERQVSISVEEVGGKVVVPPNSEKNESKIKLGPDGLPPIVLESIKTAADTIDSPPEILQKTDVKKSKSSEITNQTPVIENNTTAKKIDTFGVNTLVTFQAVSLSSVNAAQEAKALVAKIKQTKLNAYIESAKNGQGIMVYRVKVGPFPRESAGQIRSQLEKIGLKPFESYHQ